jgi:hypothetical protein
MLDLYLVYYIMWMIVFAYFIYMNRRSSLFYGNLLRHDGLVFANYADTFFRMELRD